MTHLDERERQLSALHDSTTEGKTPFFFGWTRLHTMYEVEEDYCGGKYHGKVWAQSQRGDSVAHGSSQNFSTAFFLFTALSLYNFVSKFFYSRIKTKEPIGSVIPCFVFHDPVGGRFLSKDRSIRTGNSV